MNRIRILTFILLFAFPVIHLWGQTCDVAGHDGNWSLRNNMPVANSEFGAAETGGLIYAAGGFLQASHNAFRIYNPKKDEWTDGPDLQVGVHHATVVAAVGKVYVIGGTGAENVVQIFDPATQSWSRGRNMPTSRSAPAGVEVSGKIHVIGGSPSINNGSALNAHEIYDPVLNTWTSAPPLPTASEHVSAVLLSGKIYVIGGRSRFSNLSAVQVFNTQTQTWSQGPTLRNARSGFAAVVFEKRILVFGGEDLISRTVVSTTERLDPSSSTWSFIENPPITVHGDPGITLGRFIYLFGGSEFSASGDSIDSVQRLSISNRPKSPKDLVLRRVSSSSVRLNWTDQSDNESGFDIQSKTGNQKYKTVATVTANAATTTVTGLVANTDYVFRVRARNGCGTSGFTNTIQSTRK